MLYIAYLSNYYDNSYSIMLILILPENFMLLYIYLGLCTGGIYIDNTPAVRGPRYGSSPS